ncbi:hypothetical protein [Roseovarius salinarum]|uniref:hypothetical protein n=1 Tax=Roseovarius salinarum TaxID=1981892 RepID=UPI000C3361D8|nr:hypothetical protein [Roseovarius salinarum]
MKRFVSVAAIACLTALPLYAEEGSGTPEDGRSLMERGAELFFEGMRREMAPAMEDLRGMAEQMGPALREFWMEMGPAFAELMDKIDDISAYHPPEMLPNGDIILRRKTPEEMEEPPAPGEEIEI